MFDGHSTGLGVKAQGRGRFAHTFVEERQVLVELPIIERAKSDAHSMLVNGHQTLQLEERQESPPRQPTTSPGAIHHTVRFVQAPGVAQRSSDRSFLYPPG